MRSNESTNRNRLEKDNIVRAKIIYSMHKYPRDFKFFNEKCRKHYKTERIMIIII